MRELDLDRIPRCCPTMRLERSGERLVCSCGTTRPVADTIIVLDPNLNAVPVEASSYELGTRHRYQSRDYAHRYMERYRRPRTPYGLYAALVAARERAIIRTFLRRIATEVRTVLDLPAGTGKLAGVHAEFGYRVVAADVSAEMLRIGLRAGAWDACDRLDAMAQTDATRTGFDNGAFDCTVCLRLVHRLPREIADATAAELRRVTSRYVIVAGAVRGRSIGHLLRRASSVPTERTSMTADQWDAYVRQIGTAIASRRVMPGLSGEVVTLVRVNAR